MTMEANKAAMHAFLEFINSASEKFAVQLIPVEEQMAEPRVKQDVILQAPRLSIPVRKKYPEYSMRKAKTKKAGRVQKIIKPLYPSQPEKAEISVEGADHLYREIRIDNAMEDENGKTVKLKEGAEVNVVIEADKNDTTEK